MATAYTILVVEDNAGDYALIEEFLFEKMNSPSLVQATSYKDAEEILLLNPGKFDVVLLDLSLPDKKGEALIVEMMAKCPGCPVIVLTGYADFAFGVKSLSLGISDYLLKEELTALSLYKSVVYSLERKKAMLTLEDSEKKYSQLFHLSPLPMWVVDVDTLRFLDVNTATVKNYGYSREEFLSMNLRDIRLREKDDELDRNIAEGKKNPGMVMRHVVVHKKKNGELRYVEVQVSPVVFKGINANIVIATDITDRLNHIKAIELQNEKLKEIAWMQSHVVRAPLARMMGAIYVVQETTDQAEKESFLECIVSSANELDDIIKDISKKSTMVDYEA